MRCLIQPARSWVGQMEVFCCFLKIIFIVIQLQLSAFSPHPSTPPQPNPPPSPTSTLPLGFVHVFFIVAPVNPSPHYPDGSFLYGRAFKNYFRAVGFEKGWAGRMAWQWGTGVFNWGLTTHLLIQPCWYLACGILSEFFLLLMFS